VVTDQFDADALAIALALAASPAPVCQDDIGLAPNVCLLCDAETPGHTTVLTEAQHTTSCPWRAARDLERRMRKA
jgi:hypothetical protein